MTTNQDVVDRFSDPLYTATEAARYLGLPTSTFNRWAHGYRVTREGRPVTIGAPVITSIQRTGQRQPAIPFVGLAEGYCLAAIRASDVPLQRIRPALSRLQTEIGLEHALASQRLFTDGAEILFDYAKHTNDEAVAAAIRQLVVVRSGQRVLNDVVDTYLRRIEFASDGYAQVLPLPGYTTARLVADPRRGFGQPVFVNGGVRLEDALALFDAGETLATVAEEYGVPREHLEDAVRVAARVA